MNPKQLTIAIVAPYFPPGGGGLERYAYEIAKRLQGEYRWRVVVITSGERYGKDSKDELDGLTVYRLGYQFKFSNTPFSFGWFKTVRHVLKIENPDIINVHMPVPGIGDIASLFADKKPIIVTYHAGSMHKGRPLPDFFIWLYEHGPMRLLLSRATRIVCSSDFTRFRFLQPYLSKSLTITPGVDMEIFTPNMENRADKPTVLFVGMLNKSHRHKGLGVLINAVDILRARIQNLQLVIVGDGDMRPEYEASVRKRGMEKMTTFRGRLSGGALVDAYQRSNVLCLPSLEPAESFGMVLIEAMAVGCPVIGSRAGGIPGVIDHGRNGLLVLPGDLQGLVAAIARVLGDKDLSRKMGEDGLRRVREDFTWGEKVKETQLLFQKVLVDSKRPTVERKRLSVLIICKEYLPHVAGGLGVHYFELIQELKKYCKIDLICAREKESAEDEEIFDNLHIHRMKIPSSFPLNHIVFNLKAFSRSLGIKRDIVHLCSPFGLINVLIKTSPVVVKIHTVYAAQRGARLYNRIYFPIASLIDRFIIFRSDYVMTTSNFMKKDIHKMYGIEPSKISVIFNGINKKFFVGDAYNKKSLREKMKLPVEAKIVLYVGRFVQRKGALNLVRAASTVLQKFPKTLFVFIGGGFTEGTEYEGLIHSSITALGLRNNVLILPWVTHDQVLEYYKVADIFVHPATYEPFGNNIVEAMAAGLPVISTKSGGPEEIIQDNGIILESNEPSLISESIISLCANEERSRHFSYLSKKRAAEFSWDSAAKETVKIYNKVLSSNK